VLYRLSYYSGLDSPEPSPEFCNWPLALWGLNRPSVVCYFPLWRCMSGISFPTDIAASLSSTLRNMFVIMRIMFCAVVGLIVAVSVYEFQVSLFWGIYTYRKTRSCDERDNPWHHIGKQHSDRRGEEKLSCLRKPDHFHNRSSFIRDIARFAWSAQRIPTAVNLDFLDRSRYFFIQVAPQVSSRG
jgi:hypothetical protein